MPLNTTITMTIQQIAITMTMTITITPTHPGSADSITITPTHPGSADSERLQLQPAPSLLAILRDRDSWRDSVPCGTTTPVV